MGAFATGQVVLIPFPFSDLSRAKMRPAIVLADASRGDWILCQVTSNPYGDEKALEITDQDFKSGSLRVTSYARPGKLFTASENLIARTVGVLNTETSNQLIDAVIKIFQESIHE
jgi:mRNA interferase MazF